MADFLFKTEPSEYSFADLRAKGEGVWDGVRNPVALKNLREMKKGDRVFVYHTGSEKAVVGIARAASAAYPDPKAPAGSSLVVIAINSAAGLLGHLDDGALNWPGYDDARYRELFSNADAARSEPVRNAWLHAAESRLLHAHALIPLYFYTSKHLVAGDVHGFEANPLDRHASRWLRLSE